MIPVTKFNAIYYSLPLKCGYFRLIEKKEKKEKKEDEKVKKRVELANRE
jgi:hypothetical protein